MRDWDTDALSLYRVAEERDSLISVHRKLCGFIAFTSPEENCSKAKPSCHSVVKQSCMLSIKCPNAVSGPRQG